MIKTKPFRFSLRSLCFVTVSICLVLGWIAHLKNVATKQRKAVEPFLKLNASIKNDNSRSPYPVWLGKLMGEENLGADVVGVFFIGPETNDQALRRIAKITTLKELVLRGTSVSDAGLTHLQNNKEITQLYINSPKVTDIGAAKLGNLPKLKYLGLSGTKVTGKAFAHGFGEIRSLSLQDTLIKNKSIKYLKNLSKLKRLSLQDTGITGEGLAQLAVLASLKELNLRDTALTDAGLAEVALLSSLEELDISGTQVTDAGLARLQSLKRLKKLNVAGAFHVTDEGMRKLHDKIPFLDITYLEI